MKPNYVTRGLLLFLVLFAFVLASFPARNTDLWAYLASGSSIARGSFANLTPSWLFDLFITFGQSAIGERGLVVAKALALSLLAGLLFFASPRVTLPRISAFCIAIAILAVSPRMNLAPSAATFVLLGLLTWLFHYHVSGDASPRFLIVIAILFFVWACLDRGVIWGCLFLILVKCVSSRSNSRDTLTLFMVSLIGMVAGIAVSRNWSMPIELSPMLWANRRSPLSREYFATFADNPAVLSYYPLLIFSALSFVMVGRSSKMSRILPWLAFAVLSLVTDRMIPHFAIVAGPILAGNWADALSQRPINSLSRVWVTLRDLGIVLVMMGVLVIAWPGWLQGPPYGPRRWEFDLPKSPPALADLINADISAGRWNTNGVTLHGSRDSWNALRWLCPNDPSTFDPEFVAEFVGNLAQGQFDEKRFREKKISRVVVHVTDRDRQDRILLAFSSNTRQWRIRHAVGGIILFERIDATPIGLIRNTEESITPNRKLDDAIISPSRWAAFTDNKPQSTLAREELTRRIAMIDLSKNVSPVVNRSSWPFEQAAGIVAAGVIPSGAPWIDIGFRNSILPGPLGQSEGALVDLSIRLWRQSILTKDDRDVDSMFAAVQAGRQAILERPEDPLAHFQLGEAYAAIFEHSRERAWQEQFRKLGELRQAQITWAIARGLELSRQQPVSLAVLAQAHRTLSRTYERIGFLDLALENVMAYRAVIAKQPPDKLRDSVVARDAESLTKAVQDRTAAYERMAASARIADRAEMARDNQLPGRALAILLDSDVAAFGEDGLRTELELLIRTGRAAEVATWATEEHRDGIGVRNYHWLRVQAAAALGDYESADRELTMIVGGQAAADPKLLSETVTMIVAKSVLSESPQGQALPHVIAAAIARSDAIADMNSVERRLKNLAEVATLRGILAYERGERSRAKLLWEDVLIFQPIVNSGSPEPIRSFAQSMLLSIR